ncbi:MAG: 1-acyl-sn-glycerol-3-phosphate acyltransferase [Oscillospiraceae bacterium]|nr:1-acyl-sn-glycerol-3-phosphate acyltransferase [Oscillospiraceae bacterium]
MNYNKPRLFYYRTAQAVSWLVSKLMFRRKILRNEIKEVDGPFVVIANHQASLDFVNLIGMTKRPMTFVISNSFYSTLPVKGFMDKMGVIPKQQFQTSIKDMKLMKAVTDAGQPLVIYPAGLMCEDGLSTPIPAATYKFLKWLKADIYVARTSGTYFAMPKWTKGFRPGRTYMDVYKLFTKEELANADISEIREKTENAILFDAYREQEELRIKYANNSDIRGLEHVLYMCPHCKSEFTIVSKETNKLCCTNCGYEQSFDAYAFMHKTGSVGQEIRYVSDWSKLIYTELKDKIRDGVSNTLSASAKICMIDEKTNKFTEAGRGIVTLSPAGFNINGTMRGEAVDLDISIANVPSLPFSPGKYLEVQRGNTIYRCYPDDGKLVMKFINMIKIFYELDRELTKSDKLSEAN